MTLKTDDKMSANDLLLRLGRLTADGDIDPTDWKIIMIRTDDPTASPREIAGRLKMSHHAIVHRLEKFRRLFGTQKS